MESSTELEPAPQTPWRVLIVDDEEGMLEVSGETLRRMGRLEIVPEPAPQRAYELILVEQFDLLITNLHMPGMSGIQLVQLVKRHLPTLPILVVTGYPMAETAEICRDLGVTDYLTKPFLPEELTGAVRRALVPPTSSRS